MEDKTARIIVESSDNGETCDIIIENVSPTSAIYMATKLVTAVAKQFSKSEEHLPLLVSAMMLAVHDQCKSATIKAEIDKQAIPPNTSIVGMPMNRSCTGSKHPGVRKLQRLLNSRRRMKDIESHLQRLEVEAQDEKSNTPEQQLNLNTAQRDLNNEFRNLSKERYELWTLICKIPNDIERTFLENRYYFGMSMKEVIEDMSYSESQIYNIQRNAVKSFCQVFSKNK